MQPSDYYRWKSAEIKEADIRLVAACYQNHIGADNEVLKKQLVARTGIDERRIRMIIKELRDSEFAPIITMSGKSGSFIAEYADECDPFIAENESRIQELLKTNRAMKNMRRKLPVRDTQGKVVEPGYKAQTLFDIEPEIRGYRNSYEER